MADQLVTATELADHLQQDVDTASANSAIAKATGSIQTECGWRIMFETVSNLPVLPIVPTGPIQLPTANLLSLALTEAGIPLVDGVNYFWTTAGVVQRIGYSSAYVYPGTVPFPWRYPLLATFTHGYTTIPESLKAVCLNVAARVYDNPTGLRAESIGASQEVKSTGALNSFLGGMLTDEEKLALTPWKVAGGVSVIAL